MTARRWRPWLLVVLLLLAAPAAAQQVADDLWGRTVTSVTFDVEGRPVAEVLLPTLVQVVAGQPLTREDVRTSISRLDSLGRYDDILPEGMASATGVDVVFHLVPRHPINRFEVTGETGITPSSLSGLIRQRFGGVPTGARPQVVADAATQFLNDEGYLQATVEPSTVLTHEPEGATLILTAKAGPLTRIVATDIRTSVITPAEVLRRTGTQSGKAYRRRDIDAALTVIEDQLRGRGYYEVQASHVMTLADDAAHVVITIDAGPRVVLTVVPAGSLPGNIDDFIPIKRERSADQDLLEDSKAGIEAELRREGYWKGRASFSRETQLEGTVLLITFAITRGPKYVVDHVELPAGLALSEAGARELLEVRAGQVFSQAQYEGGRNRLIAEYRRLGFYEMKLAPDVTTEIQVLPDQSDASTARVVLRPQIVEGPQAIVSAIDFTFAGGHQVPESDLRQTMRTKASSPYVDADRDADRQRLQTLYLDRGFRTASVRLDPEFSDAGRKVALHASVNEGPQVLIGDITVVGNERVSERLIRGESGLSPGQPLGDAALQEARQRLAEMGTFRRIQILQEGRTSGDTEAHLVITVVEAPATTVGFGGGLEAGSYRRRVDAADGGDAGIPQFREHLEFSPRGFFEIGRRNLGGRNRSVNFFSRAGLKAQNQPDAAATPGTDSGIRFIEYRVTGTYQERRAFRSDSDALVGFTSEQAKRTSFNFKRRAINAELLHRVNP
ncbi:MAG: POTRA domain-containing protein, partial [Acidobacteriota bacterium]